MKWIKRIYDCFDAYKLWFIILIVTDILFSFLAWLAYPDTFMVLVGLMIVFTLAMIVLSLFIMVRKQEGIEDALQDFLLEPNETKEEILCRLSPKTDRSHIRRIGSVIRSYQSKLNDQVIELADYENYIEGWVHEMKKPLSLMTLVLDNRSDEMSPLVRQRMFHVKDQMLGDVERILYFARLGAVHKDYIFEPISLLAFCKETMEKHKTLLDEAAFHIQFIGEEMKILSDPKGLAFIVEQIIANTTKYVEGNQDDAILKFETVYDEGRDQIILHISDNGPGVSQEDLPFIFDKGFTGRKGSYTRQATGMGLFLVRKMAYDLAIQVDAKSQLGSGLTISLMFPNVKH
ncbi:sensor histidine kinase [Irregularibacter muris]|uniref:histidine kinase n=1 Tax=Irregularibacter muris TaxID=1796619 RepID=A0AAE3HFN2_9FIRM|nr:sensor histidine kinase [Irregularibacter muris]MCR1898610.1 sensor histidine kinase [Irregularibacter muris]